MKKCAGRDLNPRVRTHWCLKPAPWTSRALVLVVAKPQLRIELRTFALQVRCTTTVLLRLVVLPGFEPGMLESKSKVLTSTLKDTFETSRGRNVPHEKIGRRVVRPCRAQRPQASSERDICVALQSGEARDLKQC